MAMFSSTGDNAVKIGWEDGQTDTQTCKQTDISTYELNRFIGNLEIFKFQILNSQSKNIAYIRQRLSRRVRK